MDDRLEQRMPVDSWLGQNARTLSNKTFSNLE